MKQLSRILIGLGLSLAMAGTTMAKDHDLVINNGRVMDPETGFDQIANVGIDNGVITAITTDTITGDRIIDATGHVAALNFITGRGVDWSDPSATPKLYAYSMGMKQDGGVGERSLQR